jgi:hypothetical protein
LTKRAGAGMMRVSSLDAHWSMRIFVSIAAYRDPELGPTLADCVAKAARPENLVFGVCWQRAAGEPAPLEFSRVTLRLIGLDWRESRGACWARAQVMKLWDGEDWFFQIDSHHRFAANWDLTLLAQAAATGAEKPLLTANGAPYEPGAPPEPGRPTLLSFDRFDDDGLLYHGAGYFDAAPGDAPLPARFVSAHCLFAPGRFATEVPYDPDLYFHGEEISLALRAYTHGYDLFHPSAHVMWHHYARPDCAKHWTDHDRAQGAQPDWRQRDALSREKLRRLLQNGEQGRYGCGGARSLADYEAYAGVDFRGRVGAPCA